jgi:hypothetical protein
MVVSRLSEESVQFIIAGGWAVRFHGFTGRHVRDLDLFVDFSSNNWPRLRNVLQNFGIIVKPFEELSRGLKPFEDKQLDPVHLLTGLRGVSFSEAWHESIETTFGDKALPVRVLSKAHLILSKERSKRATDVADVRRLLDVR